MEKNYRKNKGSAGLEGVEFQLGLVTKVLLNAFNKLSDWKISSENAHAAKFDDIVLELSDQSVIMFQSKYKDNRKITKEQLLSNNSRNADFSLPMYFFSYNKIRTKFKIKSVIICTNTDIDERGLEEIITYNSIETDCTLHYEDDNPSYITFKENILPDLKKSAEVYYANNLQGTSIDGTDITDENLRDFLADLQIFIRYPSGKKLDKIIQQLLTTSQTRNMSTREVYSQVENWFKQRRGEYITEIRARAMFCEIKSDRYRDILREYDVRFENNFEFPDSEKIFHVSTQEEYLLQTLKVHNTLLSDESKMLYISPDEDVDTQRQIVEAFKIKRYKFLVIVRPKFEDSEANDTLTDILNEYKYKKVVLVAKNDNQLVEDLEKSNVIFKLDGSVTFQDLSSQTRQKLIKKNIHFQGHDVSLEELLKPHSNEYYSIAINSQILEMLVRGTKLKVGTQPLDLDEYCGPNYIDRVFQRTTNKTKGNIKAVKAQQLPETNIYDVNEKSILISDSAGMGKSTVLAKIALSIKERNPLLWVIRIDLNHYTNTLNRYNSNREQTISIVEVLKSKKRTKFSNHLEKFVFSMRGRVVLMLDGVDEVSPDYTGLILTLITQCLEATNIAKIFVTTRPHLTKELEDTLRVKSFVLQPFTKQDQIDFLARYWVYNLQLVSSDSIEMCKKYAKVLITKMSSWVDGHCYNFAAIPLEVKILAEIFKENIIKTGSTDWEGCQEYLNHRHKEASPKLPDKMRIAELYYKFIEKKREFFVHKANRNSSLTARKALTDQFDKCLEYHKSLASVLILDSDNTDIFSTHFQGYDEGIESDMLKIGIVQKVDNNFQFVNRTFAEYFFAESLFAEIRDQNKNVEFQKFFIDRILCEPTFKVVRTFLDSFLQEIVDSLPRNLFKIYKSYSYDIDLKSCVTSKNLIFILARDGCPAILRLILKCIHFKIITDRDIKVVDVLREDTGESVYVLKHPLLLPRKTRIRHKNVNTLNTLQVLVEQGGVNIRDSVGNTPLHVAAENGNFETVKFLIEKGANVCIRNLSMETALHLAISSGSLKMVELLLEHGSDVSSLEYLKDFNALHLAVVCGRVEIVKYFVESGEDIDNNNGFSILHLAAEHGRLDVVKYLVKTGVDVNTIDDNGRTALHSSVKKGELDTVRCLIKLGINLNITDRDGCTALHLAAMKSWFNIIIYLVETGININIKDKNGRTAFHLAAMNSCVGIVEYFIQIGMDINCRDNKSYTPLHLAALNGRLNIIKYFTRIKADVNVRDREKRTAIHLATINNYFQIVKHFVKSGMDINVTDEDGRTPFHLAAMNNCLSILEYLYKIGVDVNIRDNNNCTALHLAASNGHLGIVKYLVRVNADVNATDDDGRTVLHSSAMNGCLNVIKYFVKIGLDFHITDYGGRTILHLAVISSTLRVIAYLVQLGADINAIDNDGRTVLHLATESGRISVVKYLIEIGVGVNIRDLNGSTALHLAAEYGWITIVKYLMDTGADANIEDNKGYTPLHLAVVNGYSYALTNMYWKTRRTPQLSEDPTDQFGDPKEDLENSNAAAESAKLRDSGVYSF